MKKFLYVAFTFLLTFLFIGVDAKTIYLKECEYTKEYKEWLSLSEEERKDVIAPTMCKNYSNNKFNVVGNPNQTLGSATINDSSFDLREHGYVTEVKDQGSTGSCWAFATNAAIESNLLVNGKGTYDLSEAHLELATQNTNKYNRLTFNRRIDSGGNYYLSSAYLRNNWGPVLESTLKFNELESHLFDKNLVSEEKVLNNKAMLNINSITMLGNNTGTCSSDNIKDIKEYLINNGALGANAYFGATSSFNLYQYYNGKSYEDLDGNTVSANQLANHAITIVGWDDTISKDNFLSEVKPTRDGAFIVKNSYGKYQELDLIEYREAAYNALEDQFNSMGINSPEAITDAIIMKILADSNGIEQSQIKIEGNVIRVYVGDNGYQYISYDDIYICNFIVGFFDVDNDITDNVYGYDDLGVNNALEFRSNTGYLASVFDKKSDGNEKLTKLNVYFEYAGQGYEVYFANGNTKQLSQMKLIATGTSDFVGYHTINIDNELITEDKYSIVVKISSNDNVVFGVSSKLIQYNNMWQDIEILEGVQYLSVDGINYSDVQNVITGSKFHLLVKAYTNNVDEEEITPPEGGGNDNTEDDGDEGTIPPSDGENENDGNNPTDKEPTNPDGDENENDGEVTPPEGTNPEDKEPTDPDGDNKEDDETNDDGKIEILPNDKNEPNEDNEPNPSTGDNGIYIIICAILMLSTGFIAYRKMKLSK